MSAGTRSFAVSWAGDPPTGTRALRKEDQLNRFLADVERRALRIAEIVVRDRDGAVRAFHNVCRHRGTRLCAEAAGTFSKYVVCPYHSWAYDLSGALVAAPNMDDVSGFRRDDLRLQREGQHGHGDR